MSPGGDRKPAAKAKGPSAAERAAKRAERRAKAARKGRRRSVPLLLALVVAVAALAAGVLVGYAARGEPPSSGSVTVDRDVRVVTVTVPQAP
jgi:flagellar basal body-associated protein FliL